MRAQHGFTLMEAIIVMVITGIIAGMVAVFLRSPVNAYFDIARRGALADTGDVALRRIARDLATAVPNSVRVNAACSAVNCYLEFLPSRDGGRYRFEPTSAGGGDILDFSSAADSSFDVLGPMPVAAAGDFLVLFNTGQVSSAGCIGANAYEGCNRRTISALAAPVLSFTPTANPLPFDSPGHRFQIVPASGPVTYACEGVGVAGGTGSGTLRRYTGYAPALAQATPPAATANALVAAAVGACTFSYTTLSATSALVSMDIALTDGGESIALHHEVHVDNTP